MTLRFRSVYAAAAALALAGCATPVLDDAQRLALAGRHEQALELLDAAAKREPGDSRLRSALMRERELSVQQGLNRADVALRAGRLDEAAALLGRVAALDAGHPRVVTLGVDLERARRHVLWLDEARRALAESRPEDAGARAQQILAEAPGNAGARALQRTLRERSAAEPAPQGLGAAYQKPVTVEFRDAPLRSVLEGLARTSGVNFVFDRDVRADAKVSVFLKDVTVDEALKVILATQQLERKLLNERTLLVYPATQAKQREHQELVTRSFYLVNADVKQALTMVRTLAKTRDLFIDERLNLMVIRDTPEIVRLVEKLVASLDLPEPEVLLDVEVLEVGTNRIDDLGLQWPSVIQYGLTGVEGQVNLGQRRDFRASIANPALVATLHETNGTTNVLANPRLRARNREKAKIVIGEKLPVFTTTSTANVGVSASVSYLDVGLKLEVEPSVQLDDDVVMKVNLEVSTFIGKVLGPQGSVAYQIGTRQASTSLRLRDGETQVLAGLIRDEDSKSISGVPGLASMPVVGRLFGVHSDTRTKTEVVLLITPRLVRNIQPPEATVTSAPAGVEGNPGAESVRLKRSAQVAVPVSGAGPPAPDAKPADPKPAQARPGPNPAATANAVLTVATSGQAEVGGTAAVTLRNASVATLRGEVGFDARYLEPTRRADRGSNRIAFEMAPGHEQVLLLRVLPAAAGQTVDITLGGVAGTYADGSTAPVQVEGDTAIVVAQP